MLSEIAKIDPYGVDNREYYHNAEKNSQNLKTIVEDFTERQYQMRT